MSLLKKWLVDKVNVRTCTRTPQGCMGARDSKQLPRESDMLMTAEYTIRVSKVSRQSNTGPAECLMRSKVRNNANTSTVSEWVLVKARGDRESER